MSRTERVCVAVVFVDVLFSDHAIGVDPVSDVTRFDIHRMSFLWYYASNDLFLVRSSIQSDWVFEHTQS